MTQSNFQLLYTVCMSVFAFINHMGVIMGMLDNMRMCRAVMCMRYQMCVSMFMAKNNLFVAYSASNPLNIILLVHFSPLLHYKPKDVVTAHSLKIATLVYQKRKLRSIQSGISVQQCKRSRDFCPEISKNAFYSYFTFLAWNLASLINYDCNSMLRLILQF